MTDETRAPLPDTGTNNAAGPDSAVMGSSSVLPTEAGTCARNEIAPPVGAPAAPLTSDAPMARAEAVIAAAERVSHLPSELCDFIREQASELSSAKRDADHFYKLSGRYLDELNEAKQQCANTFADLLAEEEKVGELQAAAPRSATGSLDVPEGMKCVPTKPTPRMLETVGPIAGYEGENPDKDHADWYAAMIEAAPTLTYARSTSGKLDKPAMVGYTRFGVGIDWRTVIERAQREYEYRVTPEKEALRMKRVGAFVNVLSEPTTATMICETCGADRFKEPCKKPSGCTMYGTPFSATQERKP